jgi:hypothetical protein
MLTDEEIDSLSGEERAALTRRLLAAGDRLPVETDRARSSRKRFTGLVVVACLLLIPWIALLAITLPRRYAASHWDAAWSGFDVILFVALTVTAWAAWRGRQVLILASSITGTLLVCDAWFDVITSSTMHDVWLSIGSALIVELPLAWLLFWTARNLLRRTTRVVGAVAGPAGEGSLWRTPLLGVEARS